MIDLIVFVIAGGAALVGALGVVLSRNAVHSALMLVMTLFGVAVLFVAQDAHFLAAVQVIVYAGAVVVLFLFVIMLLGVDRATSLHLSSLRFQRWAALGFGVGALAVLAGAISLVGNPTTGLRSVGGVLAASGEYEQATSSGVATLGESLFSDYLYAFELTSLLLVVAVVGTVILARRSSPGPAEAGPANSSPANTGPAKNSPANSSPAETDAA